MHMALHPLYTEGKGEQWQSGWHGKDDLKVTPGLGYTGSLVSSHHEADSR